MTDALAMPAQPTMLAPATLSDRFVARLIDTGIIIGVLMVAGLCVNVTEDPMAPRILSEPSSRSWHSPPPSHTSRSSSPPGTGRPWASRS